VKAAIDFVVATFGRLDVAFNHAGVESVVPLSEITEEKYRAVFDINVWGVLKGSDQIGAKLCSKPRGI
jgi:NAD(P)-dependent dehydrogenase (short-subunit alcohol dehydrogenase family)